MQNKRFIILISSVATVIVIAFGILFYYSFQKGPGREVGPTPIELTDFGIKTPSSSAPELPEPSPREFERLEETLAPIESGLRQVSNLPVAGAIAFEKERLIEGLPPLVFSFNQDLKLGDKNTDVQHLQIFLNSIIDVLDPAEPLVGPIAKTKIGSIGKESDYFGEATKKALIRFQTKYALAADGVFGEITRQKINEFLSGAPQELIIKLAGPQKNTESITTLRFVDKLAGNVYESFDDELKDKRITATQIFGVHEASFGNNGQNVVLRYLKNDEQTIESFLGSTPENDSLELRGYFLPENTLGLSASPDGKNIFYLFPSGDNVVGVNSSIDGFKKSQIFDSAFSEWLVEWPSSRVITLATKPSYAAAGFLYSLEPSSGGFNKILGGIPGLTAKLSPEGNKVLYTDNTLSLQLYDMKNKTLNTLGISTLPEKCVWSQNNTDIYCAVPQFIPGGNYPDSWYQGEVSFSDIIWKIDLETLAFSVVEDPSSTRGLNMDATNLFLSPSGDRLFFINKKDSILWSLNLSI